MVKIGCLRVARMDVPAALQARLDIRALKFLSAKPPIKILNAVKTRFCLPRALKAYPIISKKPDLPLHSKYKSIFVTLECELLDRRRPQFHAEASMAASPLHRGLLTALCPRLFLPN
jgi:hypothetical protein